MVSATPNSSFGGRPRKLFKPLTAPAANRGGRMGYGSEAPMVESSASRQAAASFTLTRKVQRPEKSVELPGVIDLGPGLRGGAVLGARLELAGADRFHGGLVQVLEAAGFFQLGLDHGAVRRHQERHRGRALLFIHQRSFRVVGLACL